MITELHNYLSKNFKGCVVSRRGLVYDKIDETIGFCKVMAYDTDENASTMTISFGSVMCRFTCIWAKKDNGLIKLQELVPLGEVIK